MRLLVCVCVNTEPLAPDSYVGAAFVHTHCGKSAHMPLQSRPALFGGWWAGEQLRRWRLVRNGSPDVHRSAEGGTMVWLKCTNISRRLVAAGGWPVGRRDGRPTAPDECLSIILTHDKEPMMESLPWLASSWPPSPSPMVMAHNGNSDTKGEVEWRAVHAQSISGQQLLNSARPGGLQAVMGPMVSHVAGSRPALRDFDRIWPDLGRAWLGIDQLCPHLTDFGLAEPGETGWGPAAWFPRQYIG